MDSTPSPSAEEVFFTEEEPEPPCTHDELYDALRQLTARQVFVTRLFYGLGCESLSIQEISEIVGWHHSTVQEHLSLAYKKLQKDLLPRENVS